MAVLAPTSDWKHSTRDREIENSKQFALPSAMDKRQSPSPSHQHPSSPSQSPQSQHGPHSPNQQPLGAFQGQQQPQGGWTPSPTAPPFYPGAFQYQAHQQPPSPYSHSPIQQQPQQSLGPYFDPTQAQLAAQWAYQQAYYAQQHGFPVNHTPSPPHAQQRPEFFAGPNAAAFNMNPFPSGTPPPQNGYNGGPAYHPYRRPTNSNSRQGSQSSGAEDWRGPGPNPPYARPDAAGSTSSLGSHTERQRTNSNNSAHHVPSPASSTRSRNNGSPVSASPRHPPAAATSPPPSNATPTPPRLPHHRSSSSSSSNTTTGSSARPAHRPSASSSSSAAPAAATPAGSPASPAPSTSPAPRLARPSPLSQGNFTAAEKRMSRDDSELDPLPSSHMPRSGGLKGRLRRALAFNPNQHPTVKEETDDEGTGTGKGKAPAPLNIRPSLSDGDAIASPDVDDGASTATKHTKKRTRSLFNMRNASTDNISLSSTVSSASVMIRKLGSMGKLARRNSLAGITSLFKDKDKDKDGEGGKKSKKKDKSSKGEPSDPSVSMYTAEIDRSSDWSAPEMTGLSPAAKLARQHTLKSNAEAAAKAKEAELALAAKLNAANSNASVPTWEKNTTTGHGSSPVKGSGVRVHEDGTRVFVEEDIEEEPSDEGHHGAHPNYQPDAWDDDEDWDGENDNDNDEDLTIRIGAEKLAVEDAVDDDVEPWATDLRRSEERVRLPPKGILKHAGTYDQQSYLNEGQGPTRVRSNSYNSPAGGQSEPGPLAHGPSSDADLDGLHRHGSHNSGHSGQAAAAPSLPPLSFDSSLSSPLPQLSTESPPDTPVQTQHPQPERPSSIFNHPNLNSSAPALSTMLNPPPTLTHRSATAPSKRLVFANNLSVYDTFSANVYDRRSEPATWSRLTPALAQRIKEELNSYKMEEMEVHASSRVHTQFFV